MKKILLLIILSSAASPLFSQKVDSIFFHLYTDSLKKGQHNYINVDGKLANGQWLPMTSKDVLFSCNEAKFEGNELIIPPDFTPEKVSVRVTLRTNPQMNIERTIWIKKLPDNEWLPTREDIMKGNSPRKNKEKNR